MGVPTGQKDDWFEYQALAPGTKLHYRDPTGTDPLTPADVRQRYVATASLGALVLWRVGPYFGFRSGIDELSWRADTVRGIELRWCRPAKGPGEVTLWVHANRSEPQLVLSARGYSPEILQWFASLIRPLRRWFPDRVTEIDDGVDI